MEKEFGPVSAVDLPGVPSLPGEKDGGKNRRHGRDKNGVPRHRGFAFVTFTNANAARMASPDMAHVEAGSCRAMATTCRV